MSNYKVKVNNEAESREVQELFFELGFSHKWDGAIIKDSWCNARLIYAEDGFLWSGNCSDDFNECGFKELTIPQLKDLVVLKRNDVGDAQFIDDSMYKWYVASDGERYRFQGDKFTYQPYSGTIELKPIAPLKEYLVPQGNGKYALTKATEKRVSDWVEVPEGANTLTICGTFMAFWKEGAVMFLGSDDDWDCKYGMDESQYKETTKDSGGYIAWQRYTQPEEIPFVDDEPNESNIVCDIRIETATGYQLDVIGQNTYGSRSRNYSESDVDYRAYLMKFVADNKRKSLNETYAEIEQVRQDNVNNPSHYSDSPIECIDAMEAMMTPEQFIGYLRGNVFKYQWRYEKKNGIEDLKKAQWYLDKLVTKVNEK